MEPSCSILPHKRSRSDPLCRVIWRVRSIAQSASHMDRADPYVIVAYWHRRLIAHDKMERVVHALSDRLKTIQAWGTCRSKWALNLLATGVNLRHETLRLLAIKKIGYKFLYSAVLGGPCTRLLAMIVLSEQRVRNSVYDPLCTSESKKHLRLCHTVRCV
jgi:hypothetical protein